MRMGHFFAGITAFGLGLFLAYMYSPLVVMFVKGAGQPVLIILGALALLSVIFDRTSHKKVSLGAAVVFLAIGGYGFYDEYIATMDFIYGCFPVLMVIGGLMAVAHGIKSQT